MKKLFLLILIFIIPLAVNANIDRKISGMNQKIKQSNKQSKINHQQHKELQRQIVKERTLLKKINRKLKKLTRQLSYKKGTLKGKQKQLNALTNKKNKVLKDIENIQKDFINHISKNLSLMLISNSIGTQNEEDIIEEFVFQRYANFTDKHLQELLTALIKRKKNIQRYEKKLSSIDKYVRDMNKKVKKTSKLKKKRLASIRSLKGKMNTYAKKIRKIDKNKKYLSRLLSRLKVKERNIRKEADKKKERAKKKEEKRREKKEIRTTKSNINISDPDIDVKLINSSYQREKTIRYRGKKTIPPIKHYKVVSKFGTSFDKVYNIKTFNRDVILKSTRKNQKVNSVLKGTVIFSDNNNPTLNKIIIIKHSNGLHTVYSNLSKIAPSIKQGKVVKKGYVIGRVSDELTFEVGKKNYYINPLEFIASSRH